LRYPAKAGIQGKGQDTEREALDSRFRGNDEKSGAIRPVPAQNVFRNSISARLSSSLNAGSLPTLPVPK